MAKRKRDTKLPAPFLQRLTLRVDAVLGPGYPFDLPWLAQLDVTFTAPVTILVGENGAGKSTLIEAIAKLAGFGAMGGAKGYTDDEAAGGAMLEPLLSAAWLPRITQGWFLRAETFHAIAPMLTGAYLDQSHGQGFLQLFADRCQHQGLYLLDEPESALSPRRQLVLTRLLTEIGQTARAQVIMATHSPILMATPGAALWELGWRGPKPVALEQTDHFQLYRDFIRDPAHVMSQAMELQ